MAAGILLLIFLINGLFSSGYTSIALEDGEISGDMQIVMFREKTYKVDRYVGIPYAKPPVGNLRFMKPEPYGRFQNQQFSATEIGKPCPQYDFMSLGLKGDNISEDCLFLNIYVPHQDPDEPTGHAVMFFIHGGGFTMGTGNLYRSEVLASSGNVIVVTINYRLGLLGFMDIDDPRSPGNFGLWDQRLALQWVNKNIGAFGGNKDRVTIFGESAGSMSVAIQMMYPPNKGLFRSAITESGSLTMPMTFSENNIESAKYFAQHISCNVENMDEVFNCLQKMSEDDFVKVVADAMSSGDMAVMMNIYTSPTVDGDIIKMRPGDLYKLSKTETVAEIEFFRSIKLINGINGAEGAMFLGISGKPDEQEKLEISREQMNTQHIPGVISIVFGSDRVPETLKETLISEYTDSDDPNKLREQLLRLNGDMFFNVPGIELSRIHSNSSNVDSYVYNFIALLDKHLLPTPEWVKQANHGDELGPVFGYNFDSAALWNITDYSPPEWELDMSERIMTYWANFAKSGYVLII